MELFSDGFSDKASNSSLNVIGNVNTLCTDIKIENCMKTKQLNKVWAVFLIVFVVLLTLTTGCIEQSEKRTSEEVFGRVTPAPTPRPTSEFPLPNIGQSPSQVVAKGLQSALDDYAWKLDLVAEQTTRLDMYYATKAGDIMKQQEFKLWLDALKIQTDEFIKRNNDAIAAGRVYIEALNTEVQNLNYDWYSREHDRVVKNEEIMKSDINKATANYNQNVASYNSAFAR